MSRTLRLILLALAGALAGVLGAEALHGAPTPCPECPVCPAGVPQDAPPAADPSTPPAAPAPSPDGSGAPL